MKKIMLAGIILTLSFSANAFRDRKDVELMKDANGSPKIGIQYAVGIDKLFSVNFSILAKELVGKKADTLSPTRWSIVDKTSGAQVIPWMDVNLGTGYYNPDVVLAIAVSLDSPDYIMSAVNTLKNSDLAIMGKHGEVSYVNIQQICRSNPEKFLNLDTMESGCE